jgi:ribosomal-protein-alanine N-acetyltransferase
MTQLHGIIVRKAIPEDLQYVEQINLQTLPENYPEYFFKDIYERYSEAFFVAEVEGKIIGYIMCRMESGVSHFGLKWTRRGHIVSVSVQPQYRRHGLGTQLIRQSLEAMAAKYNVKEVILEVRVTNKPAICLYEIMGFKRIRTLKAYYRNGDDALLMALKTGT